ncbi:hypothetical protein V3C99_015473 [Haemonchus contortus]
MLSTELPAAVQEKLIELADKNSQLKVEVQRLSAKLSSRDEILYELEEENLQLRNKLKHGQAEDSRLEALQQKIISLETTIEEKTLSSCRMAEQIKALTASLNSANSEISELRKVDSGGIPEETILLEPSNNADLERIQEERDDAVFELQRATHRIAALEAEKNDYADRAEAASTEARDMARHNKDLREQLHELEAEVAASRTNTGIASRGNSMFAEFAEERLKLEDDLKELYHKYNALRKENSQLANELDEARLLALRRGRREETHRCRCQQLSAELVELRGRVRTLDDRLAIARNDLIDKSIKSSGIDVLLKSSYKSVKLEMESLRLERNQLRDERDDLFDKNASLIARAANAETLLEYANDEIETLKIQMAMLRERSQKNSSERVRGEDGDTGAEMFPINPPVKLTPSTAGQQAQTPAERQARSTESLSSRVPAAPYKTLLNAPCGTPIQEDQQSSFFDQSCSFAEPMSEVRPKKIRFLDKQNEEGESPRRNSISASELRRLQRKKARKAKSKVLPVFEYSRKDAIVIAVPTKSSSTIHSDTGSVSLPPEALEESLESEVQLGSRHHSILETTKEFNKTMLEDVIEEKENECCKVPSEADF